MNACAYICMHTNLRNKRMQKMTSSHARYRTIRLKDEEYQTIKKLQKYLVRKGTDSINWQELRRQNIVGLPDEDEHEDDLTMGFLLGIGAAALAYLIWKGAQR